MVAQNKPIRYVNLSLSVIILIILLVFIQFLAQKTKTINLLELEDNENFALSGANTAQIDCNTVRSYCFDDDDCLMNCEGGSIFSCRTGVCVNTNVIKTQVINECSTKKGQLAYFVGDTQLGRYNSICKSIDPGVAPDNPNEENRMCMNGDIDIDYRKAFPSIEECSCINNNKIIIPFTQTIRSVATCVSDDLFNYFNM